MAASGERAQIPIRDLTDQGEGIGRLPGGDVVFVAGGVPGDQLLVRLRQRRRSHWQAELTAVVEPSPDRRRPPCILADHCGGCSLQALADPAQSRWKEERVRQTLLRIAGLEAPVRPIATDHARLGYRNRAILPLERLADGSLRAGYYRRGSHRIVNLNRCPVLDPRIDALIAPLKQDLEASGWPVDRHGGGGLRHLALRVGQGSGEMLITLVSADPDLEGVETLAHAWMARWPELVGVCLNLQPQPGNRLLGDTTHTLAGRGWLIERFAGLRYRIGADSFFQINTHQAEAVVPLLQECLGQADGLVLDAYCGIGTFSLPLARSGWRVHGIEQHRASVRLARHNAVLNGLEERAGFESAAVGPVLAERLADHRGERPEALVLDPPRKGLDGAALQAILAQRPRRVAYLSCDPATQARDLAGLCGGGAYRLHWLQPIDFFPNTSHVECLACLEAN